MNNIIKNSIELCLCPSCASAFYNIPSYKIIRKNYHQNNKDTCTYCNCRLGYDYIIFEKSNMRNSGNCNNRTLERGAENE